MNLPETLLVGFDEWATTDWRLTRERTVAINTSRDLVRRYEAGALSSPLFLPIALLESRATVGVHEINRFRGREEEVLLNLAKLLANGYLHEALVKVEFAEMKIKVT
jgi:hypothetical protein